VPRPPSKVGKTPRVLLYLDCSIGNAGRDHFEEQYYATLALALKAKLEAAGCKVVIYALLEDLIFKKKRKLPKHDLCMVLHWEWPHDLKSFFAVYDAQLIKASRLLPSYDELTFFRSKGKIFRQIIANEVKSIPTTPSLVMDVLIDSAARLEHMVDTIFDSWEEKQFLSKPTFSPKGQVTKKHFFTTKDDVRKALYQTCTEVRSAMYNKFAHENGEEQHGYTLLQKWEPAYSTKLEIVMFFSCGVFLYALGSYGWTINGCGRPKPVLLEDLHTHFPLCTALLEQFPALRQAAVMSLSFGPGPAGPVFRTAALLPPLWGGPRGTASGYAWEAVVEIITNNQCRQVLAMLGSDGASVSGLHVDAKQHGLTTLPDNIIPGCSLSNNFPRLRYELKTPKPEKPVLMIVIDSHHFGERAAQINNSTQTKKLETQFYTMPIERLSYREISREIEKHFTERGVEVCYYSIDEDMLAHAPCPAHDVSCFVFSDWPTYHDDPEWLDVLLGILADTERPCVPNSDQLGFIWKKTNYLWALMEIQNRSAQACHILDRQCDAKDKSSAHSVQSETKSPSTTPSPSSALPLGLPSLDDAKELRFNVPFLGDAKDCSAQFSVRKLLLPTMLLCKEKLQPQLAQLRNMYPSQKFLVKENYSAAKLGVSEALSHELLGPYVERTIKEYEDLKYAEHVSYMSTECICQLYSDEFRTSSEIRLFFSRTEFLYAVGYFGWIPHGALPSGVEDDAILGPRLATVRYIMQEIPKLAQYPIIRFDFGPHGVLNEIEVQCDLFGGPTNDLKGESWNKAKSTWAAAYCTDIEEAFGDKLLLHNRSA
jgi:hypothetical protein